MAAPTETPRQAGRRTRLWKVRLLAMLLGGLAAFLILEVGLRVVHPFEYRVRGDAIVLPPAGKSVIDNPTIPGLGRTIVHVRNSIGFRGPEPPADLDDRLSVLTVGGSTTECYYISDGKTWPDLLARRLAEDFDRVWLNNAGLDGHSTVGHLVLLSSRVVARLRPKVVVFLVGCNDMARGEFSEFGVVATSVRPSRFSPRGMARWLARYSEAVHIGLLAYEKLRTKARADRVMGHGLWSLAEAPVKEMTEAEIGRMLQAESPSLATYEARLTRLMEIAKARGIGPILVTQPMLLGHGIDPATGRDLATVGVGEWNGAACWRRLELYNDVTRDVGARLGVAVVDLARLLPKDSALFYDLYHFTDRGCEVVAGLLAERLVPELTRRYPQDLKR